MDIDTDEIHHEALDEEDDEILTENDNNFGVQDSDKLPDGMKIKQISTLNFAQIKSDMIVRLLSTGNEEDKQLAQRTAEAQTLDHLWSISNSKKTIPMNAAMSMGNKQRYADNEFAQRVKQDTERNKTANYQEYVEAERKRAFESFAVKNEETGELRIPDSLSKEQVENLSKDHHIFVAKELTPAVQAEVTRLTNFAPTPMRFLKNSKTEADDGDESMAESVVTPEEVSAKKIEERALAVTEARRFHINSITETTAKEVPFIDVPLEKIWWLQQCPTWRDFLPISPLRIEAAVVKRAGTLRLSIAWSPAYADVVYVSKLLYFLKKEKSPHVVSFFSVYQIYDAIFSDVIGTNIRPNHSEFLAQEETKLQQMSSAAQTEKNVKGIQFCVAYGKGIARAKDALALDPPWILTPYVGLLELGHDPVTGEPFTLDLIKQHSKQGIAFFVKRQKELRHQNFMRNLHMLEEQKNAQKINARQFLEQYYQINHILCVELLNVYEYGIMFLFEHIFPPPMRAELRTMPDIVKKAAVDKSLPKILKDERQTYSALREHVHREARESTRSQNITFEGVKITHSKLPSGELVDKKLGACSPTYRELSDFYRQFNTSYGTGEKFTQVVDKMNGLYNSMQSSGFDGNLDRFLRDEDLKKICDNTDDGGGKKKRRK